MQHELLAPAGNLKIFYAVINAGADAVYVGGPKYGARAYAKNFTEEDLIEAITYAHLFGKKVYMTFNTLLKNDELLDGIKMIAPFYEAGLDGVIVQDIAVIPLLKRNYPLLPIHSSTQMSISNCEGARLMQELGIKRIVTSRELSLNEIKSIKETGIEVECFIHGALCYSYSGQCLLSSMIGGRSGNRGRCAQPCRLSYDIFDANKRELMHDTNILSLKDLCTIEILPKLLDAGIDSLKIEGRMKQASYAYTVVSMYRKYLDLYEQKREYKVEKQDYQTLLDAGNRNGFTTGYYEKQNGKEMITFNGAMHESQKGELDEELITKRKSLPISIKGSFSLNKRAYIEISAYVNNVKYTINHSKDIIQEAQNKSMEKEQIIKQLTKTGNSFFTVENIEIENDNNIFIPVSALNEFRREALDLLLNKIVKRRDKIEFENEEYINPNTFNLKQELNVAIHLQDYKKAELFLNKDYINSIYIEGISITEKDINQLKTVLNKLRERKIKVYLALPYVFREKGKQAIIKLFDKIPSDFFNGIIARSYDGLQFAREKGLEIISDQNVYAFSDIAKKQLLELGIDKCTIPYELNENEIYNRDSFHDELLVYGRVPVMITANCINKNTQGCNNNSTLLTLKDKKGYEFPVINYCNACYNIIYNSEPTCLFNKQFEIKKSTDNLKLSFITESEEEIDDVLCLFEKNVLRRSNNSLPLKHFTWGHYHRIIE